jgi:hypothetical protein
MSTPRCPSFADLAELETELRTLLALAKSLYRPRARYRIVLDTWYSMLKPQVTRLVGIRRQPHPVLGTMQAYDLVYDTVLSALKYGR